MKDLKDVSETISGTTTVMLRMSPAFEGAARGARDLGDAFARFTAPIDRHRRRERNRALLHSSHAHRSRRALRYWFNDRMMIRAPARKVDR